MMYSEPHTSLNAADWLAQISVVSRRTDCCIGERESKEWTCLRGISGLSTASEAPTSMVTLIQKVGRFRVSRDMPTTAYEKCSRLSCRRGETVA